MDHKAIAIIPARGGSKRIPNKNIVDLDGFPLIAHTIKSVKKIQNINDQIFVSTEDKNIAKMSLKYGAKIIERPSKLASDTTSTLSVLKHAVKYLESEGYNFDTVVLLQATSPFRKNTTIDLGIKKLWKNWEKYDSIFSVKPTKFPPNWMFTIKNDVLKLIYPNDFSRIRGQDLQKTYEIDGVLYVIKKDVIKKVRRYPFIHKKSGYLITNKIESIDIDDKEDLKIARSLLKK